MNRYLLSIDNGLTETKAVLFDLVGKEIAISKAPTPVVNQGPRSEVDMDRQWDITANCIKAVIKQSGIQAGQIIAIGGSGHGAGAYLLDKAHKPLGMAITSMDERSADLVEAWSQESIHACHLTCHPVWAGQAIPILRWIKLNEPERYKKIAHVLAVKDWIKFKLTGRLSGELTDASNSGLINLALKAYDPVILETFEIHEMMDCLPPLSHCDEIIGHVSQRVAEETGLQEGTPVVAGLFDVVACCLGSGIVNQEAFSMIAGTWNINSAIEKGTEACQGQTKCSLFADGIQFIHVESSATSAVNLEWFIDRMFRSLGQKTLPPEELYLLLNQGVDQLPPSETGLFYLPFLHGSHLAPNISAGFTGLKAGHSVFHLVRAIYEGVAYAHRMHIDLLRAGGVKRELAVLSGGAANSPVWCQIFADVLGIKVATMEASQTGALGSAVNGALAAGIYADYEEAVTAMTRQSCAFHPGPDSALYQENYLAFKKLLGALETIH